MIPTLGFAALVTAFFLSFLLCGRSIISCRKQQPSTRSIQYCIAIFFCTVTAFSCLVISHIVSDFSVLNVAVNSHTQKPMLYKITGTWGNHEGSMLLWATVLSIFTVAFALLGRTSTAVKNASLLAQSTILIGFFAFILFTSNPFERLFPVPENGMGLNPLLQDIGLALHPPLLYLGYVGFSITFSTAIALLIYPQEDTIHWARAIKPWAIISWAFLTLGIGMGSWWAYRELGWGGFWFWDPVENASLMPWLAGTALVHSLLVLEKRDTLKRWCLLLALLTFSLSLLGTFLVRSGVLTSVHSFANDPQRGIFILGLLAFFIGTSLTLYAFRAHRLEGTAGFAIFSRETSLLINNLFLLTACATVILGTLYPLVLEVTTGTRLSIGAPYFNHTFNIIVLPLLALAVIGPSLQWKQDNLKNIAGKLLLPLLSALIASGFILWLDLPTSVLGTFALALSVWLVAGIFVLTAKRIHLFRTSPSKSLQLLYQLPRNFLGMAVAHLGLAILVFGITAASDWQQEKQYTAKGDGSYHIGPYTAILHHIDYYQGQNYLSRQAVFYLWKGSDEIAHLKPETRFYPVEQSQTTESAIYTSFLSDVYIAIGEMDSQNNLAIRLYYKPFINAIWLGCGLMAAGSLLAICRKRKED